MSNFSLKRVNKDTFYHKKDYFQLNYSILLIQLSIFVEILDKNDRKYPKIMIICNIYDIPPLEIRCSEYPEQVPVFDDLLLSPCYQGA